MDLKIIVLHTPVTAVKNCYECYEQLRRAYQFNVFGVDYVPGAGGIMAQYYAGINTRFRSFSQFAGGIYGNTKPLGIPSLLVKPLLVIIRFLVKLKPNLTISFTPPAAKGFHVD